jgi:signal transduction histidine kinase
MDDAKNRDPWRWGFGAAIVLALMVGFVSIVEVQRARRQVTVLALTADRSTFLVGEIGRCVSRLRILALDRLLLQAPDSDAEDRELAAVTTALERAVRELEPLLQPRERVAWRSFLRVLVRFRGDIDGALGAIRGDRPRWAQAVLAHRVPRRSVRLEERLEDLRILNEQESRVLIAAVDGRLARTRAVEALLGTTLAVALAVIWWAVQRTIRRQRGQLDRYVARIVASNNDLDAFAGRLAHDVRNAIAPLGLAVTILRKAPERPETALHVAGRLERALQSAQTLLDGLLAFSRASGVERGRAAVRRAVADVLEELAPLVERVDAHVSVQVDDVEVACAPGLLHIVVANLLGNALKFLAGRTVRRVEVTGRACDGWCALAVEDSGPGIPPDVLPRVFEPFYRAPGATVPGTGIGLATVRRITDAHGGSITVESDPGRGTRFLVRLPLADAAARTPCSPGDQVVESCAPTRPMRIA